MAMDTAGIISKTNNKGPADPKARNIRMVADTADVTSVIVRMIDDRLNISSMDGGGSGPSRTEEMIAAE